MRSADRPLFLGAVVLIGAYFYGLVRPTLHCFLTPDDLLGIHRAWFLPLGQLIKANLLFFQASPFVRPMACVLLRSLFYLAGYHSKPLHAALMLILASNLALTYAVTRRLSGWREAGAVAALLFAYHHRFHIIYFDTGYIYDPLCYAFYFGALWLYLRARGQQRPLRLGELAACCALYICALNSKEMAVTLPLILLAYELLYHPLRSWRPAALAAWIRRDARGVLVIGAATLAYVLGRTRGSDSLVSNPMYHPVLTWTQFMTTSRHFLGDVFNEGDDWSASAVLLLWALLAAVAWLSRDKALRFAWFFLMLTPLPIAFVAPRGAPQYYLVWFGWVLYGAVILVKSLAWLARRLRLDSPRLARFRGALLLLALALLLYPYFKSKGFADVSTVTLEAPLNREIAAQLHKLRPRLRHHSRLLFLNDPTPATFWNMTFVVRLSYNDRSLEIDRAKTMKRPPDAQQQADYDYVFDYRDGHFVDLTAPPPWRAASPPAIAVTPSGEPEIYHLDFSPVTPQFPARPTEHLIVGATDLGPTRPPVPRDQPFPGEPFPKVVSDIQVVVDGRPSESVLQIGWPEKINHYRVDFEVPERTRPGVANIHLVADGRSGPPATIPIR